ncbi:tumor necrosis factor receptor superfamily member 5-like [Sminthopsis crassicaudata]|uniref:tumor necrosis factor receptor superfamily member 5-like n=1 Tax=Sminthopsis crassicaudata TaxID=9301 RepID=UPI003D688BDA
MIRRECSSTSNTVCGCSPGYFCTDMKDDDCELCVPHRVCSPGQYVKSRGTERNNTICEECQAGTFSTNGTLDRCLPWTNCTAQGLDEARPGTAISDARCSQDSHYQNVSFFSNPGIIIGTGIGIRIFFFIIMIIILFKCKKKNTQDKCKQKHKEGGAVGTLPKGSEFRELESFTIVNHSNHRFPT